MSDFLGKILVVDDMDMVRDMLSDTLIESGYSVETAENGEEAYKKLDSDGSISLVVTDMQMPVLDGMGLIKKIRAAKNEVPILVLTGNKEVSSALAAIHAGADDYIPKDENIQETIVMHARKVFEKRRILDEMKNLNKRLENQAETLARELEAARQMQQSILPVRRSQCPDYMLNKSCSAECKRFSVCPGIRLCASMIPAKELAGDFYDFFWRDNRYLCFAVADVSGKGVPAALFMSLSLALLRTTAVISESPADCLARLNRQLCCNNKMSMFVTLFYGIYDTSSGVLRYANAGHCSPILTGIGGEISCLPRVKGAALGIIEDCLFEEHSIELSYGTTLCAYTDGVTEAINQHFDEFGEGRLAEVLSAEHRQPVDEVLKRVLGTVHEYTEGMPQADDITCLLLRYDRRFSSIRTPPSERHP